MIDFAALHRAVARHGKVVRLVLANVQGSAPREIGVSMIVWADAHDGTIGGGQMEFAAVTRAREILDCAPGTLVCETSTQRTLVYEVFDATSLTKAEAQAATQGLFMRALDDNQTMPQTLREMTQTASASSHPISAQIIDGWIVEPVWDNKLPVYIYGAGHVGRALAIALAPFAQFDIHLSDVREDQFHDLPDTVSQSWNLLPTDVMASAPDTAAHFIMTPEQDYDLELCHRLLGRSFGYAGLIGSKSKWARFRKDLQQRGHSDRQIDRVHCPVGDPTLGKHPQAIAIGIVSQLLHHQDNQHTHAVVQ
ncbi:MAG: xanthine dehydrogenase accessory protein XdhC [Roseovarius sp.]